MSQSGVIKDVREKHLPWLDLIRFFAAFLVVICHVRCEMLKSYSLLQPESQNIGTQILYYLTSGGKIGVLIFFILSGYLVGGKNISRAMSGGANLKTYIIDRAVRIGLPLISSLLLVVIVDFVQGCFDTSLLEMNDGLVCKHGALECVGNLFGLQGVLVGDAGGVFWTLAYEIWFYVLIAGFIAIIAKKDAKSGGFVGYAILCVTFIVFSYLQFVWLSLLICGIFAYYISKKTITKRCFCIVTILFVCSLLIMPLASETKTDRVVLPISPACIEITAGFLGAIFIGGIVNYAPKRRMSIKINNWGTMLASFSYSLYLTHYQVIRLMRTFGIEQYDVINAKTVFFFLCEVLFCVLSAYLFYLLTERQTGKVKRYVRTLL